MLLHCVQVLVKLLSAMPLSVPCLITFPSPFHYRHATFSSVLLHPWAPRSAFPVQYGHQRVWRRNHRTPSHVSPHPPGWQKLTCSTWQNNAKHKSHESHQPHKILTSPSARNFPQRFLNILSFMRFYTVKRLAMSAHLGAHVIVINFRLDLDNILIFHVRTGFKANQCSLLEHLLTHALVALRENCVTLYDMVYFCDLAKRNVACNATFVELPSGMQVLYLIHLNSSQLNSRQIVPKAQSRCQLRDLNSTKFDCINDYMYISIYKDIKT